LDWKTGGIAILIGVALCAGGAGAPSGKEANKMGEPLAREWRERWEQSITEAARKRYCDTAMGEEIGWLVSPFLAGFYYGYLATRDPRWVDRFVEWADAWIRRGIREPDGYTGWPRPGGASTGAVPDFVTDNQLGEAMALRPLTLMADTIRKTPELRGRYQEKAEAYLKLSEQLFEKWDRRGCWREVKGGGLWVVPPFGIDPEGGQWTEGYARRHTDGFSMPANKQNLIALWLIALYDVTRKPLYKERAKKWWRLMKTRIREREGGKFWEWNYWDPAGPWDYRPDGSPKHWIGVHPNGGYYAIDLEGIVSAYEHGLVFSREDIRRLVATNRDFMWNRKLQEAQFRRIDGGEPDPRWKDSPGVLWEALVPYDATLRQIFEANHNPSGWGGLSATPWYLALRSGRLPGARRQR